MFSLIIMRVLLIKTLGVLSSTDKTKISVLNNKKVQVTSNHFHCKLFVLLFVVLSMNILSRVKSTCAKASLICQAE